MLMHHAKQPTHMMPVLSTRTRLGLTNPLLRSLSSPTLSQAVSHFQSAASLERMVSPVRIDARRSRAKIIFEHFLRRSRITPSSRQDTRLRWGSALTSGSARSRALEKSGSLQPRDLKCDGTCISFHGPRNAGKYLACTRPRSFTPPADSMGAILGLM